MSPNQLLPALNPNSNSASSSLKPIKANMCCLHPPGCVAIHWSMVDLSGATPFRENWLFLFQHPSVTHSSSPRGGNYCLILLECWDFVWLALVAFTPSQSLWIHVSNYTSLSRKHIIFSCSHLPPLVLTPFMSSLPQWSLSLERRKCETCPI